MTSVRAALCTSTIGDSPETVMVSSRPPTDITASTLAVNCADKTTPSRTNVEKPGSVNSTVQVSIGRLTMVYCPWPSVMAICGPAV